MVSKWWHYSSYSLVALIPAAFLFPANPVVDYSLALVLPFHSHIGLNMVVTDYVPPAMRTVARGGVLVLTSIALLGLLFINIQGEGLVGTVSHLWGGNNNKKKKGEEEGGMSD